MYDGSAWWILQVAPDSAGLCASVGFEFKNDHPTLVASLPASERPYRNVGHDYTMPVIGSSTTNQDRKSLGRCAALKSRAIGHHFWIFCKTTTMRVNASRPHFWQPIALGQRGMPS
jgi:hypothetical protein